MNQKLNKIFIQVKRKITIFDIGIAFIVLGLLVFLFFLLFRQKNETEVIIRIDNFDQKYAFALREGQKEKDELGRPQVELTKIQIYSTTPNTRIGFLTLAIQAVYSKSNQQYSYKGQPIIVGMPLRIELDKILLNGVIVDLPGRNEVNVQKKEIEVEAKLLYDSQSFKEVQGVPEYIVNSINVGDTMKDSRGETILTVLEKNVIPAKRYTFDASGRMYLVDDLLLKNVTLKLKVVIREYNQEKYYLDAIRLSIGESIPIVLNNVTIYPTLTEIYGE